MPHPVKLDGPAPEAPDDAAHRHPQGNLLGLWGFVSPLLNLTQVESCSVYPSRLASSSSARREILPQLHTALLLPAPLTASPHRSSPYHRRTPGRVRFAAIMSKAVEGLLVKALVDMSIGCVLEVR